MTPDSADASPSTGEPRSNSIASHVAVIGGLGVLIAYVPFAFDYFLYSFWAASSEREHALSSFFGAVVLMMVSIGMHVAVGVKAMVLCAAAGLDAATEPGDRLGRFFGTAAAVLGLESWPLAIGMYARTPIIGPIRFSPVVVIAALGGTAVIAILATHLLRRAFRKIKL